MMKSSLRSADFTPDVDPDAEVAAWLALFETLTAAKQRSVIHHITGRDRDELRATYGLAPLA
ncbi:hypothetical protein [Candidatus Contendibacter odensensis]|uniref:Uncharacterized protein n=1 Tax=Candidatus Contendobacter odensis Run_B_J11 TaxID=1400861 RepID=A0A7U7J5N3_9GAMM|nr:hypothetical protein [Candidatus Contendobacter odensis]CDH47559.1 hypothetical protein BN874_840022 [Candidatus Contendobacter odensis Run_B_J11]